MHQSRPPDGDAAGVERGEQEDGRFEAFAQHGQYCHADQRPGRAGGQRGARRLLEIMLEMHVSGGASR